MSADDRSRNLVRRKMMQSAVRGSVQRAKQAATEPDTDTTDYGEQTIQNRAEQVVGTAENAAISTARISYKQFRVMQDKREQRQKSTEKAAPVAKSQTASQPTIEVLSQQERREQFKRGCFRAIAIEKAKPQTPKADSALPQEQISQSQLIKTRQQSLKRQHFIREAVRRHFQRQAEQRAATSITAPMRIESPTLPGMTTPKKAAATRLQALFRYLMSAIKQLLARTARRTAATLAALLGAGGVVLMLAMVIGAAAAVIGSPMGILFADESGDPNSIRIAEIVAETNADFGEAINEIVAAHPECSETTIEYDYEDGHTWASYWPEVLAVFAVQNNLNNDGDVVVIDESKKRLIQDTFWAMHEISAEVEEVTVTPEPTEDEPDPEPATEYILHIAVSSKYGGRAGRFVPLYARPAGHFAPAAFRGNAPQSACPVRRDCCCRWRVVLAAAGAHLYILPLRGSGRLRQCRASRHRYSRTGGNTHLGCPQRHGAGQRLERQLRQSGAAG